MSRFGKGHLLLVEVDDEVLLRLELPGELGCRDLPEAPFLGFGNLVGLHVRYFRNYSALGRRPLSTPGQARPSCGIVRKRYVCRNQI